MQNENTTQIPTLFSEPIDYDFPCTIEDSWAPNEVEVKLEAGNRTVYILAPITKVNLQKSTIQVQIIGKVNGSFLVSLPGEVENAGSTIKLGESEVSGVKLY